MHRSGATLALSFVGLSVCVYGCRGEPPVRTVADTAARAPIAVPAEALRDLHHALAEFRRVDSAITTVEPEDSVPFGDRLALFVLHATGPGGWRDERHGVFVVDGGTDRPVLTLDILDRLRYRDYIIRVEWADSVTAVVCGAGATYGDGPKRIRYRYDLSARRVMARTLAPALTAVDLVSWRDTLYVFLAPHPVDRIPATVAIAPLPVGALREPRYRMGAGAVDSAVGQAALPILALDSTEGMLVLHGSSGDLVRQDRAWRFAPAAGTVDSAAALALPFLGSQASPAALRRFLAFPERGLQGRPQYVIWDATVPTAGARSDSGPGMYRLDTGLRAFFPLPRSDYTAFARYRPKRVDDGLSRDNAELDETIGPFTGAGGAVWFGTTFYDGEGHTGVGAVGSFTGPGTYRIWHPKALVDWSTSAILVEGDTVWLGLVGRPEGSEYSGGLLAFRPSTEATTVYAVPDVIRRIRRVRSTLVLATSNGLYSLERGALSHLVFEGGDQDPGLVAERSPVDPTRRCP